MDWRQLERLVILSLMVCNVFGTAAAAIWSKSPESTVQIIGIGIGVSAALYGALQNVKLNENQAVHLTECHKTQAIAQQAKDQAVAARMETTRTKTEVENAAESLEQTKSVVLQLKHDSDKKPLGGQ